MIFRFAFHIGAQYPDTGTNERKTAEADNNIKEIVYSAVFDVADIGTVTGMSKCRPHQQTESRSECQD